MYVQIRRIQEYRYRYTNIIYDYVPITYSNIFRDELVFLTVECSKLRRGRASFPFLNMNVRCRLRSKGEQKVRKIYDRLVSYAYKIS